MSQSFAGRMPPHEKQDRDCTLDELLAVLEFHEHELRVEWCGTLIWPRIEQLRQIITARFGPFALRAHDTQAELRHAQNGVPLKRC